MSTTVEAANISDWSYIAYGIDLYGLYHVFLSDLPIGTCTYTTTYTTDVYDLSNGAIVELDWNNLYVASSINASYGSTANNNVRGLHLIYNGLSWEAFQPYFAFHPRYYSIAGISGSTRSWVYCYYPDLTTFSTNKPSGFPDIDLTGITIEDVENKINNALNSTTSVTTEANSINQQVTNNYISYSNGDISLTTLQANIDSLVQQLEDLNSRSGTTLSDKVAINNAITQTQIVQDAANKDAIIQEMEEDLTVSSSISSTITGKINQANQIFTQYSQGSTTQTEAVTQINQYITQLTQLITPQTPTADINAINAAINTINGIKDSVTSHSDLDDSVSESAQNSDKEELEYLENIEAETTENIDSLKTKVDNSISESQANQVKNNVIAPILQNTLIVKVLPIAALFMVLAVTLGFKYRL